MKCNNLAFTFLFVVFSLYVNCSRINSYISSSIEKINQIPEISACLKGKKGEFHIKPSIGKEEEMGVTLRETCYSLHGQTIRIVDENVGIINIKAKKFKIWGFTTHRSIFNFLAGKNRKFGFKTNARCTDIDITLSIDQNLRVNIMSIEFEDFKLSNDEEKRKLPKNSRGKFKILHHIEKYFKYKDNVKTLLREVGKNILEDVLLAKKKAEHENEL